MRPRKDRTMATREKTPAPTGEPLVQLIPIDKVTPPSENRDDLGDMEQLIASVKARGVSQAILVRPNEDGTYQIVFGERRWRAAKEAGHTTIKAEIRELDDLEAALEQIAENMDRQDLTSLEKAKALRRALAAAKRQGVRLGKREWAVHLGRLVRQVGKQTELVERVLHRGLRFGVENEVNAELKGHERRQARAKVMADLEAHGVILAPDDWRGTGAQRLASLEVDPEGHRSEPCHAVWVDSAGEVEPICMNPERHAEPPASTTPSPTGTERGEADSPPGIDRSDRSEAPARSTRSTSGTTPSAGSDNPATREARRRQQEEEERRAREEAERREREEAERARTAELQGAASKRRETLQTWLTSSGRLPRPLSDGYLFWQVVNLLADQTAHTPDVCDLLQVEIGDSSSLGALLDHAKKVSEQLRRVALALVITWAEDRLGSEEDWLDPFIHQHYRLLGDLGYQPSEIETQELAKVGAGEPSDKPGEDAAEQGDT